MGWGDVANGTTKGSGGSSGGWGSLAATVHPAHQQKHGGGILGALGAAGHWLGSKASLAGHDIAQMPGGTVHMAADFLPVWLGGNVGPGGTPGLKDLKAMGKQTAEVAQHPLRDPFATALTVAPVASVLGKGGEAALAASDAARAGEGVGAAAKAAGKALVEHGGQPSRTLHVGSERTPVTLIGSRNAAVRLAQRGYDQLVQKTLDREAAGAGTGRVVGRVAKHGMKRVQGALREEELIAQRLRAVPANMLDQAAMRLTRTPGRSASRLQHAAAELTSTQTTPEEAALYHLDQARKGVKPDLNLKAAKLYQQVAKRDLVHVDESRPAGQKVFINPAHEKLATADTRLAAVQAPGDKVLTEHGVMTPEQLRARTNAPARVRAGAGYEPPTPGKLGIESPALKVARATRDRIAALHEKALQQDERWLAKQKAWDLRRPMTKAEAQARLAELDKQHQELVDKMVPLVSPYVRETSATGRTFDREQLRRNTIKGKTGHDLGTVKQEEQQLAEAKMADLAARHADKPWGKALQEHLTERQQLQQALHGHLPGEEPAPLPAAGEEARLPFEPNPHRDRIVTTGHALEQAQQRVTRLENAAAKRVKPTGIVGGEGGRPGRGFVSYRSSEKLAPQSPTASSRSSIVGEPKPPIDTKTFTGENIRTGKVPRDVFGSASRHYRTIMRFVNTDAIRRRALETGSNVRRSKRDILIAIPGAGAKRADITAELKQVLGAEKSNLDQAEILGTQEGLQAAHKMFVGKILERADSSKNEAIGAAAPDGFKWVDQSVIRGLEEPSRATGGPGAGLGRIVDNTNAIVTGLTVYFKVGHIGTRVLTNAATNLMQGSLRPDHIVRTGELWRAQSDTERARMMAAAGQPGFAALPADAANIVGRTARRGAQFWARHADSMFRYNSLAYELRKAGYRTVADVNKALDALEHHGEGLPAHEWSKISTAARRADREAIAYDRLNPFERRYLTRGIWFYPWIKGSTLFTVRTMLEHPVKGAILGTAGVQGRERQQAELGSVPSYEQGLLALTGGSHPLTTDLSTFSPFATAGQLLQTPEVPGSVAGYFNPVLGSAGQFAYGLNAYGAPSTSPVKDALLALGSATPEQQLAEALAAQGQNQSGRMFVKTPGSTILRYLVGPGMPRRVNKGALAKAAARERSGRR